MNILHDSSGSLTENRMNRSDETQSLISDDGIMGQTCIKEDGDIREHPGDKYRKLEDENAASVDHEGRERTTKQDVALLDHEGLENTTTQDAALLDHKGLENTTTQAMQNASPVDHEGPESATIQKVVPVGLRNLGNTCYFNSAMQCIAKTGLLRMVLHKRHRETISGELRIFYDHVVSRDYVFCPQGLFTKLCQRSSRFHGGRQQDSHELLRHLMDGVKEEEKEGADPKQPYRALTSVDRVFGGHFLTVFYCHSCNTPYHLFEPFLDISLPIAFEDSKIHSEELPFQKPNLGTPLETEKHVRSTAVPSEHDEPTVYQKSQTKPLRSSREKGHPEDQQESLAASGQDGHNTHTIRPDESKETPSFGVKRKQNTASPEDDMGSTEPSESGDEQNKRTESPQVGPEPLTPSREEPNQQKASPKDQTESSIQTPSPTSSWDAGPHKATDSVHNDMAADALIGDEGTGQTVTEDDQGRSAHVSIETGRNETRASPESEQELDSAEKPKETVVPYGDDEAGRTVSQDGPDGFAPTVLETGHNEANASPDAGTEPVTPSTEEQSKRPVSPKQQTEPSVQTPSSTGGGPHKTTDSVQTDKETEVLTGDQESDHTVTQHGHGGSARVSGETRRNETRASPQSEQELHSAEKPKETVVPYGDGEAGRTVSQDGHDGSAVLETGPHKATDSLDGPDGSAPTVLETGHNEANASPDAGAEPVTPSREERNKQSVSPKHQTEPSIQTPSSTLSSDAGPHKTTDSVQTDMETEVLIGDQETDHTVTQHGHGGSAHVSGETERNETRASPEAEQELDSAEKHKETVVASGDNGTDDSVSQEAQHRTAHARPASPKHQTMSSSEEPSVDLSRETGSGIGNDSALKYQETVAPSGNKEAGRTVLHDGLDGSAPTVLETGHNEANASPDAGAESMTPSREAQNKESVSIRPGSSNQGPSANLSREYTLTEYRAAAEEIIVRAAKVPVDLRPCSVLDSLRFYTRKEELEEYLCLECNKGKTDITLTRGRKQIIIYSPPAILTIHLKRFEQTAHGYKKVSKFISFEAHLDLAPFSSVYSQRQQESKPGILSKPGSIRYSLYGVVVHSGSLKGGHYTACVRVRTVDVDKTKEFLQKEYLDRETLMGKNELINLVKESQTQPSYLTVGEVSVDDSRWFDISDSWVREISLDQVLKQEAYLLFYERVF